MKHPAYRCSDILFVAPEYRNKAYDYLWYGIKTYILPRMTGYFNKVQKLPEFKDVKLECKIGLEQVGSAPFGCASLHSDWDFNLNLPDWNSQAVARQWYFAGTNRKLFVDYLMQWERDWGFRMDVGCIDPMTDLYNVHVRLGKAWLADGESDIHPKVLVEEAPQMTLHRRGSKLPRRDVNNAWYTTDDRIPEVLPPIDLKTWNPEGKIPCPDSYTPENPSVYDPKIHVPPIAYQHLQWDGYAMRWLSGTNLRGSWKAGTIETENPFQAKYVEDEWADEAKEFEKLYGPRYTGYTKVGEKFVENLTPFIVYPTT